jgi:hypothetical protein
MIYALLVTITVIYHGDLLVANKACTDKLGIEEHSVINKDQFDSLVTCNMWEIDQQLKELEGE